MLAATYVFRNTRSDRTQNHLLCSGPESNRRAIPVDKVALPLSYPSMSRFARRSG